MKAIIIILFALPFARPLVAQDIGSDREDFLTMASYLSQGSGKWMTENPKYNPNNPYSTKAFGLWFTLEFKQSLLRLTHVAYKGDTAHVTGESFWLWHPGEQRIKYYSVNIRGGFTNGETYFESEESFTTAEYSFSAKGKIRRRKDVNTIISAEEHQTNSYYYDNGAWHAEGNYTFRKTLEKEHYKVIKRY